MAVLGDLDESKQDERYNPATNRAQRLSEQENDAFSGIASNFDKSADSTQEDGNISKAKDQEEGGGWDNKTTPGGRFGGLKGEIGRQILTKGSVKGLLRKKGPLGLIITIFLGGGIGLGGMFGGVLAPFAFIANVTDDLNDQLAAMDVRSTALMRNRIGTDAKKAIAGCTTMSIKCKFKTISETQKMRLERAGIKVTASESTSVLGKTRYAPTEYTFRGNTYDPKAFGLAMNGGGRTNQLKLAYKRALNMKFLGFSDTSYVRTTLARWGITKKAPELKGTRAQRAEALMNRANTSDIKDVKFSPVTNEDGTTGYTIDGDTQGTVYDQVQKDKMQSTIDKTPTPRPPSRIKANAVKGLSVIGTVDLACTVKNMIGVASIATKIANQAEVARYAVPVAAAVAKIQAGDGTVEDGETVGDFFGSTDNRDKIVDIASSVKTSGTGQDTVVGPADGNAAMIDNPDKGTNVMNSPLYKMSSSGTYNTTGSVEAQYSVGAGKNVTISSVSDVVRAIDTAGGDALCGVVQNWFVRGIGIIAGVALAVGSSGTSLALQGAAAVGLFAVMATVQSMIDGAISGSLLAEGLEEAPRDRAAVQWTGLAVASGRSAQDRGLIPTTEESFTQYNKLRNESMKDYTEIARADANPLDIKDQYSFLGSIAYAFLPYATGSTSIASTAGNILTMPGKSLGSLLSTTNSSAAPIDTTRFKQCGDEGYSDLKLAPDVQCNLRYYMPEADLALDTGEVAQYMEDNGYVEVDTTTGLPQGYTPPSPQASQGFAMDMLNGVANSFYSNRDYTGAGGEYAKYLDYCVYRAMPFGKTYEESGAFGSAGKRWITGEACLNTNDEKLSNFRIYTLDKTVSEAEDGDSILPLEDTSQGTTGGDYSTGDVNPDGWAFPTTAGASITSPMGWRSFGVVSNFHTGVDLDAPGGSPFYAARDGVISTNVYDIRNVYNDGGAWCPVIGQVTDFIQKEIRVNSEIDGVPYTTVYAHASEILKKPGDVVKAGELIGYTGGSGCSSGDHVHFEIWQSAAPMYSAPFTGLKDPVPIISP